MSTYHLTVSATVSDPTVVGELLGPGGLFEEMPGRLAETAGVEASSCHFQVIDSSDPEFPDTTTQIQALIEYLGEDVALQALQARTATTVPRATTVPLERSVLLEPGVALSDKEPLSVTEARVDSEIRDALNWANE